MKINKIIETGIYCDNVAEMVDFYTKVLGLELLKEPSERTAFLQVGENLLIIFNRSMTTKDSQKVPPHGATGPTHLAFEISPDEYNACRQKLINESVEIEKEVHWEHSGITSLYFRDPAGNSIELMPKGHWPI